MGSTSVIVLVTALLLAGVGAVGCDAGGGDPVEDAGPAPDAGPALPDDRYRDRLTSVDELFALAADNGEVRFLLHVDGAAEVVPVFGGCAFQDMNQFPFHLQFLKSFPEHEDLSFDGYVDLVLERPTRIWWGGGLRRFPDVTHPTTGEPGVVTFTVYATPDVTSALTVDDVVDAAAVLGACAPFAGDALAFLPGDQAQTRLAVDRRNELLAAGVTVVDPSALNP